MKHIYMSCIFCRIEMSKKSEDNQIYNSACKKCSNEQLFYDRISSFSSEVFLSWSYNSVTEVLKQARTTVFQFTCLEVVV